MPASYNVLVFNPSHTYINTYYYDNIGLIERLPGYDGVTIL